VLRPDRTEALPAGSLGRGRLEAIVFSGRRLSSVLGTPSQPLDESRNAGLAAIDRRQFHTHSAGPRARRVDNCICSTGRTPSPAATTRSRWAERQLRVSRELRFRHRSCPRVPRSRRTSRWQKVRPAVDSA